MNHERRVVLSVAAAAGLSLVALVLSRLLSGGVDGGWFVYAPGSEQPGSSGSSGDGEILRDAAIWLAAIGLWLGFSWRLFRDTTE